MTHNRHLVFLAFAGTAAVLAFSQSTPKPQPAPKVEDALVKAQGKLADAQRRLKMELSDLDFAIDHKFEFEFDAAQIEAQVEAAMAQAEKSFELAQLAPVPPVPPLPPMPPMAFSWNSGKGLTPEEELKLTALEGLMRNDAKRALPYVEKLMQPPASERMRIRALSTLRRSELPEAKALLAKTARNNADPKMQAMAIRLLGSDRENVKLLSEIYASTTDSGVKRTVLRGWLSAGAHDEILRVAKSETSTEVRADAIRMLGSAGNAGSVNELVAIYKSTQERPLKSSAIRALAGGGHGKALIEIARAETDPELKREAIRSLTNMRDADVTAYLMEVIGK